MGDETFAKAVRRRVRLANLAILQELEAAFPESHPHATAIGDDNRAIFGTKGGPRYVFDGPVSREPYEIVAARAPEIAGLVAGDGHAVVAGLTLDGEET